MTTWSKHWIFPCFILIATCFGVFVLPFLLPPPHIAGVSVANAAGFNNKVAAVAAAAVSIFVFLAALRRDWPERDPAGNWDGLSRKSVLITVVACAGVLTLMSLLIVRSHFGFPGDAGYFINRIEMHVDYGRKLYTQIEFPYGPLILYVPIAVHTILSPFHISLSGAYYTTLILEHVAGLLLVAYVLNGLPMLHRWRKLLFILCAVGTLQANMGLNYTFLRFVISPAFLVLADKRRTPLWAGVCIFSGEIVSLAVSPEMAFAFGAASFAYALYFCYCKGRAWIAPVLSPFLAVVGFFLVMDRSYLLMLQLFAKGILNFIVEPLPHILIFLFALVWLVPFGLAVYFRQRRPEAPLLAALFIFSLALLPVDFGRADPGHIFFDGLMVFFLSMVVVPSFRPAWQTRWAVWLTCFFLWSTIVNALAYKNEWRQTTRYAMFGAPIGGRKKAAVIFLRTGSFRAARSGLEIHPEDHSFTIKKLDAIVGNAPVATPMGMPLYATNALQASGQYTPSFYFNLTAILDASAEEREIEEFNTSQWALLPVKLTLPIMETQKDTTNAMGIYLPYPERHAPYEVGGLFRKNLANHWQLVGEDGDFLVYRHR